MIEFYVDPNLDEEGVIRVLHGRAKAAVHWATERTCRCMLNPNNIIDSSSNRNTIFDIFQTKHPLPSAPTKEALIDVSI